MGDPDEKDQIGLFDGCMIKDTFPERSTTSSVFGSSEDKSDLLAARPYTEMRLEDSAAQEGVHGDSTSNNRRKRWRRKWHLGIVGSLWIREETMIDL